MHVSPNFKLGKRNLIDHKFFITNSKLDYWYKQQGRIKRKYNDLLRGMNGDESCIKYCVQNLIPFPPHTGIEKKV